MHTHHKESVRNRMRARARTYIYIYILYTYKIIIEFVLLHNPFVPEGTFSGRRRRRRRRPIVSTLNI